MKIFLAHRVFISNAILLCAGCTLLVQQASANSITWNGSSNSTFSTNGNWVGGTAPANSTGTDIGVFTGTPTANLPDVTAARSINGLVFSTAAGGWTLSSANTSLLTIGTGGIDASLQTSGTTTISGPISASTTEAWRVGTGGTLQISGATSGGGALTFGATGALGTITLGSSTRTGTAAFFGGTLQLGDDTALGSGQFTMPSTNSGAAATISATGGARSVAANVLLANSFLTISGSNDLTFNGKITGSTGGSRILTNNIDTGKTLTLGTVDINNDATNLRSLTLSGTGNTIISGIIANGLGSTTANTLIINNTGITTLSGANSYTGTTTVNGGILTFLNTGAKASGTVNAGAAGTIGLGVGGTGYYSSANVASLFNSNALTGFNLNAAAGVAIDTSAGNFTQSNALTAARALTKLGANTLTLNQANTYTGTTTVSAGTLLVNGGQTGAGAFNVSSEATLGGTGSIATASNASVTLANGASLSPGDNSASNLTFALGAGSLDISAMATAGRLLFTLGTQSDKISLSSGTLNIGTLNSSEFTFAQGGGFAQGTYTLFDTNSTITAVALDGSSFSLGGGFTGTLAFANANQDINLLVVPEPATWALLAFSLTTVTILRRRHT